MLLQRSLGIIHQVIIVAPDLQAHRHQIDRIGNNLLVAFLKNMVRTASIKASLKVITRRGTKCIKEQKFIHCRQKQ